ncbi:MAG: DUF1501 domain-containing protein, partial [Verrucomicrobiae bacterium]|nr:DUF1501 domain-containing protein [Verrucomicrobiae bacterium]
MNRPSHPSPSQFCGNVRRREFLHTVGGGFPALALTGLLGADGFFGRANAASPGVFRNPLESKPAMAPAKAKSVIFIFCYGGPSHIDTFDHKPRMYGMDGKTIAVKTFGRGGKKNSGRIVEPKWKFKRYGQCGKWVSDLFPHLGGCVDDIAFLHSMTADSPIHGSALLMMNCGSIISGKPSLGSWVNYGLGSVNENLPGYVVMLDQSGGPISGAKNWTSGFMPASYQGTVFRSKGDPILNLKHVDGMSAGEQRTLIDSLNHLNAGHLDSRFDNTNLAARIASYELAYKMQATAPEAIDLDGESAETKALYGIDQSRTEDFGRKCLLARRLVERGVRFIQ